MENEKKGRKRSRHPDSWKDNVIKKNKNEGKAYVSTSGKLVPEKTLAYIESCCRKKCFDQIEKSRQKVIHRRFWGLGEYQAQNVFISDFIKIQRTKSQNENRQKQIYQRWTYLFPTAEANVVVCKAFFCRVLSISKNRVASVQTKLLEANILNATPLRDNRGKYKSRTVKLTNDVKTLIQMHCESISHSESHYARESTKLKYFENPELSLTTLYHLFVDYYFAVTGNEKISLDQSTYAKYFNHNVDFSFSKPRIDVCNLCFINDKEPSCDANFSDHKKKVEEYRELKKEMLKDKEVLSLEFDFAQNLPLPKLPVLVQFYRRLFWLYVFNIHVHNSDRSYMFPFLEGCVKKSSNTVANCLLYIIELERTTTCYNKIYLFSDACGGQNRNCVLLVLLSMLSVKLQIEITHVYPVRGHSYCQCDRNFGLYGIKKKKVETIETAEEYIEMIKTAKDPNFIIIEKDKDLVLKDLEVAIANKFAIPKDFKISKAAKIVYYSNGTIDDYENYTGQPVSYKVPITASENDLISAPNPSPPGITSAKLKDVQSLLHYLSPRGQAFLNNFFKAIAIKNT